MDTDNSIPRMYAELAETLFLAGRLEDARRNLELCQQEADASSTSYPLKFWLTRARFSAGEDDWNAAFDYARQALEADPGQFSELSPYLDELAIQAQAASADNFTASLDGYLDIARQQYTQENYALTQEMLTWLRTYLPDNLVIILVLGVVMHLQGDKRFALTLLHIAAMYADLGELATFLGDIFMTASLYVDAVLTYGKALEVNAEDVQALRGRGKALQQIGLSEQSAADLEKAVALLQGSLERKESTEEELDFEGVYHDLGLAYSSLGKNRQAAEALIKASSRYNDLGSFDSARQSALNAVDAAPKNWHAHFELGRAQFGLDAYEDAAQSFNAALEIKESYQALCGLAEVSFIREDFAGSQAYLDKALQLNADYIPALQLKGQLLNRQENYTEAIVYLKRSIRGGSKSRKAVAYLALGDAHAALNEYADAIDAYRKSVERNPNFVEPFQRVGLLMEDNDMLDDALNIYQRANEIKETSWAYQRIAKLYYDRADYENAVASFDKALVLDPADAFSCRIRGYALRMLGRYDEAIEALQLSLDLDTANGKPENVDAISDMGEAQRLTNRMRESQRTYQRALEIDPEHVASLSGYGAASLDLKEYDKAIEYLKRATELDDKDPFSWGMLGAAYSEKGMNWSALLALERSVEFDKNRAWIWNYLGFSRRQGRRYAQALEAYDLSLGLRDDDPWTLYEKAYVLRSQDINNCPNALYLVYDSLILSPQYAWAYIEQAICQYHIGLYEESLLSAAAALKLDSSQFWVNQVRALVLEELGRADEARVAAEAALGQLADATNAADAAAYEERGNTYSGLLAYEKARQDFNKCIELDPDYGGGYNNLAWLLGIDLAEDLPKAHSLAEKAVELARSQKDDRLGSYLDTLGWITFKMGKEKEALRLLQEAVEKAPEDIEVHDHLMAAAA